MEYIKLIFTNTAKPFFFKNDTFTYSITDSIEYFLSVKPRSSKTMELIIQSYRLFFSQITLKCQENVNKG